jgi:hypothetical protein
MSFGDVSKRFASKMAPLAYQRPQAAPSDGNIAQAEKIIASLGAEGSLDRRFARLDEIQSIWKPEPTQEGNVGEGVFSHLKGSRSPNSDAALSMPKKNITFVKFVQTVLPVADSIQVYVTGSHMNFAAIVTAVNPDAPPIIQWDRDEQRNPFSWYLYPGGCYAHEWSLPSNTWVNVNAITFKPCMWFNNSHVEHFGKGVIFVLEGAKDTRKQGASLFPNILKSDFHSIRATIERFSNEAEMQGQQEASACGVLIVEESSHTIPTTIRVVTKGITALYIIDRWD